MANIKLERWNHAFQEQISMILMREVKDEDLQFVTITGVDTTSDFSIAKVYYTVLDVSKKAKVKETLEKKAPFIRSKLAESVEIRHTPELKFVYDTSIAYGEHIERILEEIKEKEQN